MFFIIDISPVNMDKPNVSVIIPTYKRPDTLDRAINSVLNQTYPNVEVIVVDDNNPDTEGRRLTELKMSSFSEEPRVKYIKHERNKNGSAARNTGARAAKGEYLAFLDDDDEYTSTRIESMLKRFSEASSDYGACYSRYIFRMPDGKEIQSQEKREGSLFKEALMKDLVIGFGSNNLVKRSVFNAIGGFDETFKRNQDHEFLIRLLQKYKIAYCDELGLVINVHVERREESIEETLSHYVETFKPIVDTLPGEVQNEFYKKIDLNLFVHYVRTSHEVKKACSLINQKRISVTDALIVLLKGAIKMIKRKI